VVTQIQSLRRSLVHLSFPGDLSQGLLVYLLVSEPQRIRH
jgi:hypothetical protein